MPHQDKQLVAIACADIHLSARPPLYRSAEEDWLATQAGYLRQITRLARNYKNLSTKQSVVATTGANFLYQPLPVLLAGDIFDKALVPPEVITLALHSLPDRTYAVSGNHDLLNHRLEDLHRTAYGTLVAANRITDVIYKEPLIIEGAHPIRLHAFPYGVEVHDLDKPSDFYLEIALIHRYVWVEGKGYPGAPDDYRLGAWRKKVMNYDVVLFGDNHTPLQWNMDKTKPGPSILNCGSFMVRKRDEKDHRPSVGLIYSDGSIERHYLDISQDKYVEGEDILKVLDAIGANSFVESLLELGDHALDFSAYITRLLEREKVDQRVKDIILKALERGETK